MVYSLSVVLLGPLDAPARFVRVKSLPPSNAHPNQPKCNPQNKSQKKQITCAHCFPNPSPGAPIRAVCGEHTAHACSYPPHSPHAHPPTAFTYRQRCPEHILASFQQQLRTRQTQLGAWRESLAAFQVGDRAPSAVEAHASAVAALLEVGEVGMGRMAGLAVGGRGLRLEGRDPCVQRLALMAAFLGGCLGEDGDEVEEDGVVDWAGKPAVAALAELHKRGRELGAPRHELRGLERALRACQAAADAAKRLLPEGVTKQGHLRLKQKHKGSGLGGGGRRGEGEGEEDGVRKGARGRGATAAAATTTTTTATATATASMAPPGGALGLEALMGLIAALLDFPYRLDRELAAAFRLLGAVTRARRRSWELLGVKVGEEFAALEALLRRAARRLFPQLRGELEAGEGAGVGGGSSLGAGAELEGAPRFYPQGIAPGAAEAVGGMDGAATVASGVSGSGVGGIGARKKRKGKGGQPERAYRMVKGRWEGRRFAFLPGPNVWLGVERLSKELRLLGVACPEWELLVDRGNLVLSEDVSSDEEAGGGKKRQKRLGEAKGKGGEPKKKPGRKKGWCTALPPGLAPAVPRGRKKNAVAVVAAPVSDGGVEAPGLLALEAAEGKSGGGGDGAGGAEEGVGEIGEVQTKRLKVAA